MTPFTPKDFSTLLGLSGFSDTLLKNHFSLYEGYVSAVNNLSILLTTKEPGTPEYAELKRRFGWEWNGVRFHELYFENLTKNPTSLKSASVLALKLQKQFGSLEAWEKDFRNTGSLRGIGWAVLLQDNKNDSFHNVWINEHHEGYLAGTTPLLVMDVFEHAYVTDYGIKRASYIDAFFRSLDWEAVEKRLL
ncbi:MAG: Fe-Mn family superoxide dismutase [Candidatus Moranbacteria bacterium]|nr:Fe-Mn family superoxide dismutase [Candidatus Moranbacteria bacterium]